MGRVDDAIRRATGAADSRPYPDPVDAEVLAQEPFPAESAIDAPQRIEPRPQGPTAPTRDVLRDAPAPPDESGGSAFESAARPEAVPIGAPGRPTSRERRPTLFEHIDSQLAAKVVVDQNMAPAAREQYRKLATKLHQMQGQTGLKVVMLSSAVAGEGKSLTSSNLALTLSESYKRDVLLIDGDLRRPTLHAVFQINGEPGLAEGLLPGQEGKLPLHRLSATLSVLPAGRPSSDPMAGLTSERMRWLLEEAREAFDWVIIDTPPVGLLSDANLLASMVDGVVLVVKAAATPYALVQRAVDALGRERLLGVVLNRATESAHGSHYHYNHYFTTHP
jgi:protein-tyrosine kinase